MRILAESHVFLHPPSGISRYVLGILTALRDLGARVDVLTFGGPLTVTLPPGIRWRRRQKLLGRLLQRLHRLHVFAPIDVVAGVRADAVFFTAFESLPTMLVRPRIVAIYDLTFLQHPETVDEGLRKWLRSVVPRAARECEIILTISQSAADDIARLLHVDKQRIVVASPAVDLSVFAIPNATIRAGILERYGLEPGYFFFCSTLEPRKNLVRLLDAWASLPAPRRPLVLVGGRGWRDDVIQARLHELQRGGGLHVLGRVPDADLAALYAGAHCLVFPSLYEGFGIPILEAMACGCPVVTSNVSSMPEVAGGAAVLVDPYDISSIAAGLVSLEDSSLRARCIEAGQVNTRRYSWRQSAQIILQAIQATKTK